MKGSQVVIGSIRGREAAARFVDGRLEDLLIAPPDDVPRPGAVFRARAERPLKGLGGIFVSWPGGRGFLRDAKGVQPGTRLKVQVTGFAEPGKAVPVTARLLFKSRYCIVTPNAPGINVSRSIRDESRRDALLQLAHETDVRDSFGMILRSAAEDGEDAAIADDVSNTLEIAAAVTDDRAEGEEALLDGPGPASLAWRDWPMPDQVIDRAEDVAQFDLEDQIAALQRPEQALPGGAGMMVEPTRALVAVDVNTGPDGSPAAGLKAALAAARALPRALRLRGLGGQVTIDFPPFPKKDRRQVESALRAAFRSDPIETSLVGWTPLGHFELQRKRERMPLSECLR